jgi:hypothetical protein
MTNIVFVTIAVKAPSGISQKKLTETVVESLARARGIQDELLPDTTKLEFATAGKDWDDQKEFRVMKRTGAWG